jgi:hypothetical protein
MEMKKSFLMVLAAAALVGCAKSEGDPVIGESAEITLRSQVVDASGVVSRAPFEGDLTEAHPLVARVVASLNDDFSTVRANGVMNFIGKASASYVKPSGFSGDSAFPAPSNTPVYLYGLYPSTWTTTTVSAPETTFDGKTDVMATDVVSTSKDDVTAGNYAELKFEHLLTRLEVKLSAADDAKALIGAISAIKLVGNIGGTVNVNNKVVLSFPSGNLQSQFSSVSTTSLNFYGLSLDDDKKKVYSDDIATVAAGTLKNNESIFAAYSMVGSVIADDTNPEYYLAFTTGASTPVKYIAVDLTDENDNPFTGSTAGHSFVVSVYFKANGQITCTAKVYAWENEGEWQGEAVAD